MMHNVNSHSKPAFCLLLSLTKRPKSFQNLLLNYLFSGYYLRYALDFKSDLLNIGLHFEQFKPAKFMGLL